MPPPGLNKCLRRRLEVYPSLLRPARFVLFLTAWPVFSVGDRLKERGIDAETDEVFLRCVCPSLTQGAVVLFCCPRIAVPLDAHLLPRVLPEPFEVFLQGLRCIGLDSRFVEVEINRLENGSGSWRRSGSGLRRWMAVEGVAVEGAVEGAQGPALPRVEEALLLLPSWPAGNIHSLRGKVRGLQQGAGDRTTSSSSLYPPYVDFL